MYTSHKEESWFQLYSLTPKIWSTPVILRRFTLQGTASIQYCGKDCLWLQIAQPRLCLSSSVSPHISHFANAHCNIRTQSIDCLNVFEWHMCIIIQYKITYYSILIHVIYLLWCQLLHHSLLSHYFPGCNYRYQLILSCWHSEPEARLNFTQLKYSFQRMISAGITEVPSITGSIQHKPHTLLP